ALLENLKTSALLRQGGFNVALEPEAKSMKSQMRSANRLDAAVVIIRGDDEVTKNIVICKNMADGTQSEIAMDKLADYLKEHNLLNI
ncbi:MAG: His/Gly/Thr/Pro-type tRNA ligase C-terminal domain-containing protein, partial [Victivallaceae bacterium]